jgi:tachylectin
MSAARRGPHPPDGVVIYAIKDNGDLLWYRHEGRDKGADRWAPGSGKRVGNGWNFKQVFSGGGGVIYAIQNTTLDASTGRRSGGHLAWYRHDDWLTGGPAWTAPKSVANHWDEFKQVFYGGSSWAGGGPDAKLRRVGVIIYAIKDNGDLLWYRHDGCDDGADRWAPGSGKRVGNGWNFKQVFSGDDGVIYAIQNTTLDASTGRRSGGHLAWYRHGDWLTGGPAWTAPKSVGNHWDEFRQVFYGGDGVIYALQNTTLDGTTGRRLGGHLLWYRHEGDYDGTDRWAPGSGQTVDKGWNYNEVFCG